MARPVVGLYHLEADGTDSSGASNTLTAINTPTFTRGRFGEGAVCDETIPEGFTIASMVVNPAAFTVSAWIKLRISPVAGEYSRWLQIKDVPHFVYYDMFVFYSAPDYYLGTQRNRSGVANAAIYSIVDLTVGYWLNVVEAYDGTNLRQYRNGVLVGTSAASTGDGVSGVGGSSRFSLGLNYSVSDDTIVAGSLSHHHGMIDEVIAEDRAWSAQDVRRYYNENKIRFAPSIS